MKHLASPLVIKAVALFSGNLPWADVGHNMAVPVTFEMPDKE